MAVRSSPSAHRVSYILSQFGDSEAVRLRSVLGGFLASLERLRYRLERHALFGERMELLDLVAGPGLPMPLESVLAHASPAFLLSPTSAWSSAERKRDRSVLANGAGPPIASPPARRSAMIARVAIAAPIELVVKGLPVGEITVAPALRQRSANRISAVTTPAPASARSAIQSSAASKPSLTTIRSTSG